ncbi:hypothetical protein CF327_g133 [Tilletia walkeri]|nr:hypothetical protein CF327_g133 [Tilletia walkeri]
MVLLTPCAKDITAEGVVAIVSDRVLRMGWRPQRIITDSEAKMSGAVMTRLAASLGAQLTPSTPHHQQANAVERAIQTVQHILQSLCVKTKTHWDRRALPAAELAINSTPSLTTGYRPFDLVFVSPPSLVHALVDADEHLGVDSFEERVAAAVERLEDARIAVEASRQEQKRRYDGRRAALPPLQPGDRVFIRLRDRPMPGTVQDKLDPRKMGPFEVVDVLSPHRVRVRLPVEDGGDMVFNVEQLDAMPTEADPFEASRIEAVEDVSVVFPPLDASSEDRSATSDTSPTPPGSPSLPPRQRQLPSSLRDFQLGVLQTRRSPELDEALRGPIGRPRSMVVDDQELLLSERPVAFLSRLTSPAESKLIASELELCCLAWAFRKLAHLLEGASVTVVTDHSSMEKMLRSTANTPYGPTISRCRALLMPQLPNLRFVYRPGPRHTNVDALSRLLPDQGRSDLIGGHVPDSPEAGTGIAT